MSLPDSHSDHVSLFYARLHCAYQYTIIIAFFKLKPQNVAFWAVAPTLALKYGYNQDIEERINNLWRIHENRVKRNLGGTFNTAGFYDAEHHVADTGMPFQQELQVPFAHITEAIKGNTYLASHFTRMDQNIVDYPDELFNANDDELYDTDNFERMKPFMPKEGSYVGTTRFAIPYQDTDEKYIHTDLQGENLYSNPPNPNLPYVDSGVEEDKIWNFQKSLFNQDVIKNNYANEFQNIFSKSHAPWWGKKLMHPTWYKKDKYQKFLKQWQIRLDFEQLKMKQAIERVPGDKQQADYHKIQLDEFLVQAEDEMHKDKLKDVYITDHVAKTKQFMTTSEEEDEQYFNYMKSLQAYNKKIVQQDKPLNFMESGKYERGSLLQRIFEPLAGSMKLENGGIYLEIVDKDVAFDCNEESSRKRYELLKKDQVTDTDDDSDDTRIANVRERDNEGYIDADALSEKMQQEFECFLRGEKYDYVSDVRKVYQEDLSTSLEYKIFKTLPDYVFYDIKKPDEKLTDTLERNQWNPARRHPNTNFFEIRKYEDWKKDREEMRKLDASISRHMNY